MSKRTATRELTHDNWEAEDDREEMGTFQVASDEKLASRNIKKAKRRGVTSENGGAPGVFKGLSIFSGFNSAPTTQPSFSFLGGAAKDTSDSKLNSSTKNEGAEKSSQPLKITQDSVVPSSKAPELKLNGSGESKNEPDEEKRDSYFLSNLKALNEGVLGWIEKHLKTNPHVNLTPVFDDYKKHFSELLKKYPPKKESEVGSTASNSKKDSASGKENTPLGKDDTKDTSNDKPFKFGTDATATTKTTGFSFGSNFSNYAEKKDQNKSSENSTPAFTFGSNSSSSTEEKKTQSPPTFSFGGFGGSNSSKSEGSVFGNSTTNSTGSMFGGFGSSASTTIGTGFTFSSSTPASTEKKEGGEQAEDPSDEPPKVEVNVVKEDDALYEKKCKLFYMKDGAYVDRGVGTVYLKSLGEKTQLLVRAYTNLGNILLNIILNSSIPTVRAGKNGVILVCVPNPPLDAKAEKSNEPVKMLIKVKTSEDADALLEKLEEYKK